MALIKGKVTEEEDELPKLHQFTKELTNWLSLFTILLLLIYGVLFLVYEIALDLAHVRWVFITFIAFLLVDVVAYWLCRFAIDDPFGEGKCFLHLVLVMQGAACLFYLIAPIVVLCSYRFTPDISARADDDISTREKDNQLPPFSHTFEDFVEPDPCPQNAEKGDVLWQCTYVRSIKVAGWCMWIPVIPKCFMVYLLRRILRR